jgi:hypothetical protein
VLFAAERINRWQRGLQRLQPLPQLDMQASRGPTRLRLAHQAHQQRCVLLVQLASACLVVVMGSMHAVCCAQLQLHGGLRHRVPVGGGCVVMITLRLDVAPARGCTWLRCGRRV